MRIKRQVACVTIFCIAANIYTPATNSKLFPIKLFASRSIKKVIKTTKKAASPALYTTLGIAATGKCIASVTVLALLLKKIRDVKNSYIKNPMLNVINLLVKNLSDIPDIKKYIIPGAIFLLAANAMCSAYTAVRMFKKAHKKIKKQPFDTICPKGKFTQDDKSKKNV